jgi:hypothetical protein
MKSDRQASGYQIDNILVIEYRPAKVTLQHVGEPPHILHQQWPIQPQLVPQSINLGLRSFFAQND